MTPEGCMWSSSTPLNPFLPMISRTFCLKPGIRCNILCSYLWWNWTHRRNHLFFGIPRFLGISSSRISHTDWQNYSRYIHSLIIGIFWCTCPIWARILHSMTDTLHRIYRKCCIADPLMSILLGHWNELCWHILDTFHLSIPHIGYFWYLLCNPCLAVYTQRSITSIFSLLYRRYDIGDLKPCNVDSCRNKTRASILHRQSFWIMRS